MKEMSREDTRQQQHQASMKRVTPVGALRRFAKGLEKTHHQFLEINKKRVSDFIDKVH